MGVTQRTTSDLPTTETSPVPACLGSSVLQKSRAWERNVLQETDSEKTRDLEILILFCICHVCVGFSMGAISPAMESITSHFSLSETWRGALGASALAGNILGSPMGGLLADFSGRRVCMLSAWVVFCVAAAGQACAAGIANLCVLRFILGWSVGAHYAGTTAYLSESLPADKCGRLLALVESHFFIGNFLSIGMGAIFRLLLSNDNVRWRLTLGCCAVPVMLAIAWFFVRAPETKAWVAAHKGVENQLEVPLHAVFRDDSTMPSPVVVAAVPPAAGTPDSTRMSTTASIAFVSIFWGSLIIPTYAVSAFAVTIIEQMNLPVDPFLLNTWLGAAAAVGVFCGVGLVDKIGRKPLLLLSQWGVAGAFSFLAGAMKAKGSTSIIRVLIIGAFFIFEVLNGAGAPLALVYPAEIFPSEIKGLASGVSAMNSRVMAVGSMFLMSTSLSRLGVAATLLGLGIMSAMGAVITHCMAPSEGDLLLHRRQGIDGEEEHIIIV